LRLLRAPRLTHPAAGDSSWLLRGKPGRQKRCEPCCEQDSEPGPIHALPCVRGGSWKPERFFVGAPPIGHRFGRWLVVASMPNRGGHRYVAAVCACGAAPVVNLDKLSRGSSQSCGCATRGMPSRLGQPHGASAGGRPTPEYRARCGASRRCESPSAHDWRRYGDRGIHSGVTPMRHPMLASRRAHRLGAVSRPGLSPRRPEVPGTRRRSGLLSSSRARCQRADAAAFRRWAAHGSLHRRARCC
jgi:hypothetical protein